MSRRHAADKRCSGRPCWNATAISAASARLETDHIVPLDAGGEHHPDNGQTTLCRCRDCHVAKIGARAALRKAQSSGTASPTGAISSGGKTGTVPTYPKLVLFRCLYSLSV